MLLLILILTTINSIMAFDLFWIMTRGGPGSATTVFSWMGYASPSSSSSSARVLHPLRADHPLPDPGRAVPEAVLPDRHRRQAPHVAGRCKRRGEPRRLAGQQAATAGTLVGTRLERLPASAGALLSGRAAPPPRPGRPRGRRRADLHLVVRPFVWLV